MKREGEKKWREGEGEKEGEKEGGKCSPLLCVCWRGVWVVVVGGKMKENFAKIDRCVLCGGGGGGGRRDGDGDGRHTRERLFCLGGNCGFFCVFFLCFLCFLKTWFVLV